MNLLIFHWINRAGNHHGEVLDWWMMFLSEPTNAAVPFLVVATYWFWQGGETGRRTLTGLLLLLLIVDGSGGLIKSWVQALRPCQELGDVRLLVDCGLNSFPSNHAANMAALATYIGLIYHRTIWFFAPLALAVGISRIYVGVHYPVDVFSGWVFGMIIAYAFYKAHIRFFPLDSAKDR